MFFFSSVITLNMTPLAGGVGDSLSECAC